MKTQLYSYDGTPLFEVILDETSTQDWSLMSDNKLSISFELEECVVLTAGCYIDFDGTRFYLLNEYKPTMIYSSAWKYDLTLGDAASWLSITLALKTIDGEDTPMFKYTGPAAEHAAIIVANLNRRMGTDQWKVGSVISTENIAIDYSGKYCSDVLQEIVDIKNTEWWIDGMTLNIGRAEFGERVTLGYMNGALGDIVCDTAGGMRSYAYLFPIGSSRNIDPTKYGHDRLQLPSGLKSVPINPEQGVAELVEEAAFAHIFPRYEGTVSAVRYAKATNADGTPFLIYYIKDASIPFNPNEFEIPGLVKHITFQSGELMGQEFEVNYSADSHEFELITRWNGDIQLPGGVLTPAVGDKYVVWNISMPDVYYTIASHELLDAARAYAADAIKDVSVYKVKLDYIDVQERGLKLRPGQRVRLLSDMYFASGYYDSRITRITRNIAYPDALSVDISAVRVVGTLSRLQASIQKTENVVAQFSGQLPAIIKSNDDTSANDSSVYTSAKSEKEFLNKRKGGRVAAPITFDEVAEFLNGLVAHKYIKIGNGYLRYNDELGVWEMEGDLAVTGNVSWFASIKGFKPSTIMDAIQVDGESIVINEFGQLKAIGGGSGGSGGGLTVSDLSNYLTTNKYTKQSDVETLISTALTPYALTAAIPTNNNQLSNGAGYITAAALNGYAKTTDIPSLDGYATQSWVDGKKYLTGITSSQVTNALGFTPYSATNPDKYIKGIDYDMVIAALGYTPYSSTNPMGYLTTSSLLGYATEQWVTNALDGYATQSWVDGKKYLTGITSSQVTNALGFTPYSATNPDKYIKGIDYDMVIAALGYTPYSTTNPMGYLTTSSLLGYATEQWVGSAFSRAYGAASVDKSLIGIGYDNGSLGSVNLPFSGGFISATQGTYGFQLQGSYLGLGLYYRGVDNGSFREWQQIAFTSSNVASATKLATPRTIWGQSFDGSGDINGIMSGVSTIHFGSNQYGGYGIYRGDWYSTALSGSDVVLNFAKSVFEGSLAVGGVVTPLAKFNVAGTGFVTEHFSVGSYLGQFNADRAELSIVSQGDAPTDLMLGYNGTQKWSISSRSATSSLAKGIGLYNYENYSWAWLVDVNNNVAVGGTTADAKFHVHGNILSGGLITSNEGYTFSDANATYCGLMPQWRISSGGDKSSIWLYNSGLLYYHASQHNFTDGNVVIGGSTADAKFHVHGTGCVVNHFSVGSYLGQFNADRAELSIVSQGDAPADLMFGYNGTRKWSITSRSATSSEAKGFGLFNYETDSWSWVIGVDNNMTIHGNLLVNGNVSWITQSQRSLKDITSEQGLSLAQLERIKPIKFYWKDRRDTVLHVGGVADVFDEVLPEVVARNKGILCLNYVDAAFYVGASLIAPVLDHERRITEGERERKALKEENASLKRELAAVKQMLNQLPA